MSTRAEISATFSGAKSVCTCGHLGDVAIGNESQSQHAGIVGHGRCLIGDGHGPCGCTKFTWAWHTPAFKAALDKASDAPKGTR